MKSNAFFQALLLAAPLAVASQARADLVRVEFNATIDESPFVTPGYTVGDNITGWFSYDPTVAGNPGVSDTSYPISEIHILLGGSVYKTGFSNPPANLMLWHAVNESDVSGLGKTHSSAPVDLYDLRGMIALSGPGLEGASPYYTHLVLTDLDAAFYTSPPPYPIDFPPPGVFEFQTLKVTFLGGEPLDHTVWANIDSFTVVAAPDSGTVPENGNSLGFLGLSVGLLSLHRKSMLKPSRITG
ncbi:MAG: hypothetical protein AB9869_10545 [Verrucomicrobiia bacterium]